MTLSFWIRSTVAQNFKCFLRTRDGTEQRYTFDTGSLSADTWTKITKTIPGNSNITINNDNGEGLQINIGAFWGGTYTDNSVTEDAWGAYSGSTRMKDNTSTWYTTNLATLQITGVQLEVGSVATDFEHRSFAQELELCQRYYFKMTADDGNNTMFGVGWANSANQCIGIIHFPQPLRDAPSAIETTGSASDYRVNEFGANHTATGGPTFSTATKNTSTVFFTVSSITAGRPMFLRANTNDAFLAWSSEL